MTVEVSIDRRRRFFGTCIDGIYSGRDSLMMYSGRAEKSIGGDSGSETWVRRITGRGYDISRRMYEDIGAVGYVTRKCTGENARGTEDKSSRMV